MELMQERKVEIEDGGEKLAHYFKELRSDEWLAWQQKIAAIEDADEGQRQRKIILLAYDERIVRVEGYTYQGQDLMAARPEDWRDFIPGAHKYLAWIELVMGNDLKKKSETKSES